MDTYMNSPHASYGIDYLKNLVGDSLNNGGGSYGASIGKQEDAGDMYNVPPQSPPVAAETTPYNMPAGADMGPRFKALINSAGAGASSVANAAGPVISAAATGASPIQPGIPDMMKGFQKTALSLPSGHNDFSAAGPPANINELRERLGLIESSGKYNARNPSGANGKYQYMDKTWNNYGGYKSAADAPPDVQDQRAHEDLANRLVASKGDVPMSIANHIYPKYASNVTDWNKPIPGNGTLTMQQYVSKVLGHDTVQNYLKDKLGQQAVTDHSDQNMYNLSAR